MYSGRNERFPIVMRHTFYLRNSFPKNPFHSFMKHILRTLGVAALLAGSSLQATAQIAVGITTADQLVIFNAQTAVVNAGPFPVSGLASGQTIAGADYRPRTGELFILGYNSTNGEARLYTVNQTTAVATPVGAANITLPLGTGAIGFDFNPTVDLIRVVAANRANYRLSPVTGGITATDGQLTYAAGDANASSVPSIGAGAYTNSYVGSEVTTLYDIDESLNILATQIPPNNGTLNTVGSLGIVGIGTPGPRDLDIAYDSATATNRALLSYVTTVASISSTTLYTVNLATGQATTVGTIGTNLAIKDIAVLINRAIPATVTGQLVYGLTRVNRNFFTFDSDRPGTIRSFMPVTGVTGGQRIVGMDIRPVDRRLYALGYNDTTMRYSLYTIDTATGAATAINAGGPGDTMMLGGASARIGFDFNPTVDRIRITSSNGANYRLNPTNGAVAATDGMLMYRSGDVNAGRPARVGSVAYTNSAANATSTTMYAIDDSLGALLVLDTPNNGQLRTLVSTFFVPNQTDPTNDLDFFYDSTTATNRGYLAVNTGSSMNDSLWMFIAGPPTTPPALMAVGRIGLGVQVMDIAVQSRFSGFTSVRDLAAVPGVEVYPNPARDWLAVRTPQAGRAVLLDLAGRVAAEATTDRAGEVRLPLAALPAGTYLLRLESAGRVIGAAKVMKE